MSSLEALSEKSFKPILLCLAYRAYFRRPFAGAEITADPAPPDRIRKRGGPLHCRRGMGFPSLLRRRASFRDGLEFLLPLQDLPGDIEGAVAAPVFIQVRVPIVTGADDVQVLLFVSRSQTAGAGPVSIPLFVDQQALDQVFGERSIRVEVVPPRFGFLVQTLE
jgi:hypothetical protein